MLLGMDEIQKKDGIGVMGISKSGDIALSMAAYLPSSKIKAIFVINTWLNSLVTDLLYKGEPVLVGFKMTANIMKGAKKVEGMANVISMSEMFGGIRIEDFYGNVIPFAKSKTDIFIALGLDDQIFPNEMLGRLAQLEIERECKTNCEIADYEGLGHFVDLPYDPPCSTASHPLFPYPMKVLYGGTHKQLHAHAQEKIWCDSLEFFKRSLYGLC